MSTPTGIPVIGKLRKVYVELDGDLESPDWDEVGKCSAAAAESDREEVAIPERDSDFIQFDLGHFSARPTVDLTVRPGNETYDALWQAYVTGAVVGIAVMTGDLTVPGHQGLQAECLIQAWSMPGGHTDVSATLTFVPYAGANTPPAWVQVAGY